MSIFSGLPTLGAKTSGGSKGKYKAEIITKIERIAIFEKGFEKLLFKRKARHFYWNRFP